MGTCLNAPPVTGDHSERRGHMLALLSNWTSFSETRETVDGYINEVSSIIMKYNCTRQFLQEELYILEKLSSTLLEEKKTANTCVVLLSYSILSAFKALMKIPGLKKFLKYEAEFLDSDHRKLLRKITKSRSKRRCYLEEHKERKTELEGRLDRTGKLFLENQKEKERRERKYPMGEDVRFRILGRRAASSKQKLYKTMDDNDALSRIYYFLISLKRTLEAMLGRLANDDYKQEADNENLFSQKHERGDREETEYAIKSKKQKQRCGTISPEYAIKSKKQRCGTISPGRPGS